MPTEPEHLTIMSPEEYHEAYVKIHGEPPPPEEPTDDALPGCECRTPGW